MRSFDMEYKKPNVCCVCGSKLVITGLRCESCQTEIHGEFRGCDFCSLTSEQSDFLKTFLRCRGSIKDMEREMGVSYPTVKNSLEKLVLALGLDAREDIGDGETGSDERLSKEKVFDMLSRKEITAAEATAMLEEIFDGR